ncbi:LexA/Signal peptidase, partial [Corynespora cassiicola Philippines]
LTLCTVIAIRDHLFTLDTVRGSSMSPTLSPLAHETGQNDRILIKRYHPAMPIQRGDVVTFWKPHRPEEISIKRVVAVQGDTVFPRRGYAVDERVAGVRRFGFADGLSVLGEDEEGRALGEGERGRVVVPHGHVWVEGDNWRKSYDSCDFGPVSLGLVDGVAVKVWRGWLDWRGIGDGREKKGRSRVVEGVSRLP